MKTLQNLIQEFIEITTLIETNYPELYAHLEETPVHLREAKSGSVTKNDMKENL